MSKNEDTDNEPVRASVRLPAHTMERLQDELSHFNTEAARFQFLAQFYLDHKEMNGCPHCHCHCDHPSNSDPDD